VSFASLALAVVALGPAAGAQGTRGGGRVSEEYARAAEALIGAVFPGASRDWSDDSLVWPDGRREAFRLGGFTRLRVGDVWWLAGGLDFPRRIERAVKGLEAGKAPSEAVRSRIVVVKAAADWRVLEQRVIDVDDGSPVSAVDHIELVPPEEGRWPRLEVRGASAGQSGGLPTMVWWRGELDSERSTWTLRVPAEYWRRAADGSEVQELLQPSAAGDTLELVGVRSGLRFSFPCAGGACHIRALSLFDRPPTR
jgi:hypothetical protein